MATTGANVKRQMMLIFLMMVMINVWDYLESSWAMISAMR
jgi:hypothetical protein